MRRQQTTKSTTVDLEGLWAHHHAVLRDPHQIASQWHHAAEVDPILLTSRTCGAWWDAVDRAGMTLIVTREYEHLVMALSVQGGKPRVSYLHLPHPSGLAVDPFRQRLYVASTRNPNVLFDFAPCQGEVAPARLGAAAGQLLPSRARYFPGCLYMHDLALIGGHVYANAVGLNVVVRLGEAGRFEPVWWPRSVDTENGPRTDRNYIQLNSIAPGATLKTSCFSASQAGPGKRRPGHKNWAVDRRGVIFSGATREVIGVGLTRPHSARRRGREVWVDNSGYGEVGRIVNGRFEPVVKLTGWTRGLFFCGDLAFVGTSRVIPKYRCYAPGLDPDRCESGIHAIDVTAGKVVGSLLWPTGNQIFAIEGMDRCVTPGFPFTRPGANIKRQVALFGRGRVG